MRVGKRRRRSTRARSSVVTRPARSGSASRLAAATASCTARLMPTPPIGDMAWAASPMQRRPGRYQRSRRSTRDGQEADVIPAPKLADAVANEGRDAGEPLAKCLDAAPAELLRTALRDDVAALPVVAAIDRDEDAAGVEIAHRVPGIIMLAREPEPQHVHRRAEVPDGQPGARPHERAPAVGAHHQVRADLLRTALGRHPEADDRARPPRSGRSRPPASRAGTPDSARWPARRGSSGSPTAA